MNMCIERVHYTHVLCTRSTLCALLKFSLTFHFDTVLNSRSNKMQRTRSSESTSKTAQVESTYSLVNITVNNLFTTRERSQPNSSSSPWTASSHRYVFQHVNKDTSGSKCFFRNTQFLQDLPSNQTRIKLRCHAVDDSRSAHLEEYNNIQNTNRLEWKHAANLGLYHISSETFAVTQTASQLRQKIKWRRRKHAWCFVRISTKFSGRGGSERSVWLCLVSTSKKEVVWEEAHEVLC